MLLRTALTEIAQEPLNRAKLLQSQARLACHDNYLAMVAETEGFEPSVP